MKAAASWLQRVVCAVAAGVARLDASLQDCCQQGGLARLTLLLVLGLLVAKMWPLAKARAMRSLRLSGATERA